LCIRTDGVEPQLTHGNVLVVSPELWWMIIGLADSPIWVLLWRDGYRLPMLIILVRQWGGACGSSWLRHWSCGSIPTTWPLITAEGVFNPAANRGVVIYNNHPSWLAPKLYELVFILRVLSWVIGRVKSIGGSSVSVRLLILGGWPHQVIPHRELSVGPWRPLEWRIVQPPSDDLGVSWKNL